jgi:hypothetical protein
MTRFGYTLTMLLGASLGVAACSDTIEDNTPPDQLPPPGSTTGGDGTTFDHDNDTISVWDLIDRLTKEGPPSFTSQMHSCSKVRYSTLGSVLSSLGVNLANTANPSAGQLYTSGAASMGAPNYANRIRENLAVTTSGASRMFDVFAAGADEITAALPSLARCQVGGVGPTLFDANNQCQLAGISCLIGVPAQQGHVELCNLTITRASNPTVGKRLAVAAMLAAAYTCE